jgi:transposase InsO family protein
VPLTKLQVGILRLLAAHRDPESYVAGSTPLNREAPRYSADIDIFHDREERVTRAAEEDRAILQAHGFSLQWLRRELNFYSVLLRRDDEATKLEWVVDSDFRFFPALPDELFGYMLHPVDLATNKIMAAAGRREPRDVVDLVLIHEQVLPLGAVVWAAVGKSLGFTPEGLINEIRRLARYTDADFRRVASDPPVDPAATMTRFRQALDEAEAFVMRMPTEKVGLLFLKDGRVVQPDPDRLDDYTTHAGQRRGHWPSSAEISAAMLERYKK